MGHWKERGDGSRARANKILTLSIAQISNN